jgi:ribonuclease HII
LPFLIGTDEAGYGPNLGPLVITATVWQLPSGVRAEDLYQCLAEAVSAEVVKSDKPDLRVAIADSKVLYQPSVGLAALERGIAAALCCMGQGLTGWRALWHVLAPTHAEAVLAAPWYAEFDCPLPSVCNVEDVAAAGARLSSALAACGIRLCRVACRPVPPCEFNELVRRYDSKGGALSQLTLGLVRDVAADLPQEPARVICDKHGGRNHYAALLAEVFDQPLVTVRSEGRDESTYVVGEAARRVEFSFCTQAERFMPVALASMFSKYLREMAMLAWNDYWCSRVDGLKPTAGYPGDARRFRKQIAKVQKELGIADCLFWRTK